jgi:hypothetical protein
MYFNVREGKPGASKKTLEHAFSAPPDPSEGNLD